MRKDEDVNTFSFEYSIKAEKCPCGSGKSPVKCCGPVIPRRHSVDLDPRNYVESDGLAIGKDFSLKRVVNGEILLLIGSATLTQGYPRKKNDKVLVKGNQSSEWVMHPDTLLLDYDHIFIIDTNTFSMHETRVNIACVLYGFADREGDTANLQYGPLTILEFWDNKGSAEKLGWYMLIESIEDKPEYFPGKIGIVVDSELDKLDSYNERNTPYFEDHFLPEGMEFIYATADSGSNYLNKLMRLCDKNASLILEYRKENPGFDSLFKPDHYPCRYFRQMEPDGESPAWKISSAKSS